MEIIAQLLLLHNRSYELIAILYQWDACGRGLSSAIVSTPIPTLVAASLRLFYSVFLPFDFCFLSWFALW